MGELDRYEHFTSEKRVVTYESSKPIFIGILREVRELSKKKPEGKYLDLLSDESLPQLSDAVLVMVQFETALGAFHRRYNERIHGSLYWLTHEFKAEWEAEEAD